MAMFAIASGAYWWGAAVGWGSVSFRVFYLFGAILNVPYLAAGTVWLLGPPRVARTVHRWLHLIAMFAAGVLVASPAKQAIPTDALPVGKEIFGIVPRILAGVGSGLGATVLIVGAAMSCWRLLRAHRQAVDPAQRSVLARLAITNALIATGSMILGIGGALFTGPEAMTAFGIFLTAGIVVLFVGFLVSSPRAAAPARPPLTPFFEELLAEGEAALPQGTA
jgi:hypothetical protein